MDSDGSRRHIVQAPGGIVVVLEDQAGNLFGRLRSGYVATDEDEEQTVARALEAVRELRQGSNPAQDLTQASGTDYNDDPRETRRKRSEAPRDD